MNRSHLGFVLALHRVLHTGGNLVWSPFSVASALGLAAAGARGTTRAELVAVLGEPAAVGRLLADSAGLRDAEIAVANSLWMRLGLAFRDEYEREVLGWPGGALHTADFRGDPDRARVKINADVEKTTRQLIKELLAPGMISPATAVVIVNALYLKLAWRNPFGATATRPAPFHAASGTRDVPTMHQRDRMSYVETDGWRMVTLPTTSDVVVDVLLPPPHAPGPPGADTLATLHAASASTRVDLALPRFRVTVEAVLTGPLRALGIDAAFTPDADLSGITTADRIWIDQVVHKAVLRVDEEGIEGAAATAVVMRTVSLDVGEPVPFHVDRPFLAIVRHSRTGAIYFLAEVSEP